MPSYRSLYVEASAAATTVGRSLIDQFADRPVVEVNSYHEVFSRPSASFQAQKRAPSLIAAVASPPYLYEAPSRVCARPGARPDELPVMYNDQLRNCVYNCDYCFLQGMHPCGHTLVFVNSEDYHDAAADRAKSGPYWLSVSYLSDILAFEPVLPLVRGWLDFAREHPKVTVEVRTKGEAPPLLRSEPAENFVFTWTLSPRLVAARHERGCASPANRLTAIRAAIERGWRVRLAFDPVILVPGWKDAYGELIEETFTVVPAAAIEAATYGVFRVGLDHANRMIAARSDTPVLHHPFVSAHGMLTYNEHEIEAIHRTVGSSLTSYLGADRVAFVHA